MYIPNCQYCGAPARLSNSIEIFGKDFDQFYYTCSNYPVCDTMVGCHPGTVNPYGIMANKELRQLRRLVHSVLDPLWKYGTMTRDQVYEYIGLELNLTPDEAHIGMLNKEQCETLLSRYQSWEAPERKAQNCIHFGIDKAKRIARRKRRKSKAWSA